MTVGELYEIQMSKSIIKFDWDTATPIDLTVCGDGVEHLRQDLLPTVAHKARSV
jgi:hypothetical protein